MPPVPTAERTAVDKTGATWSDPCRPSPRPSGQPEIAAPLHASLGHPAGVESAHKLAEPLLRPIPVGRRRYEDISVGPGRGSARGLWRVSCPAKHAGKS